jgi:DNA-binding CsgD family transcriptional regulator
MIEEKWKTVKGQEDKYQVSSLGRVRSLEREFVYTHNNRLVKRLLRGKILTPRNKANGYLAVMFGMKQKDRYIASLVLETFVGKRPQGYQIHHKNGDKTDNSVKNLGYVTISENIRHAIDSGLNKGNKGKKWHVLSEKEVSKIKRTHKGGMTNNKIAEIIGVSPITVGRVLRGMTFKKYEKEK